MDEAQLRSMTNDVLTAQVQIECALTSIQHSLAGDSLFSAAMRKSKVNALVRDLQFAAGQIGKLFEHAGARPPEKPSELAQERGEYAGSGMFENETMEQAASQWSDWCQARGMDMLAQFLAVAAPKLKKTAISEVYMLCDAYESGIGHGLKGDGKDGSYYADPRFSEAYRVGYKFGEARAKRPAPPIGDHEVAAAVNELRDIAMLYHSAQQLRERLAGVVRPLMQKACLDSQRLKFLHTLGPSNPDKEGYEWGVFKVKWDEHGTMVECWQTACDSSDLDAAMRGETYIELRPRPTGDEL